MRAQGYTVDATSERELVAAAAAMLQPGYRPGTLPALMKTPHWDFLPLAEYRRWFATLPGSVRRAVIDAWGEPEASPWVARRDGVSGFVIPRMKLGRMVVMPQPMRSESAAAQRDEKKLFHDTKIPLNHFYMAAYLWVRAQHRADAIVHFGTHGTQEWTPGKERGLWAWDDPNILVGNTPVVYPYIVDNIGEAVHVKRRGRGVIVSHQTPAFAPAGLSDDFVRIGDLIREYASLDQGLVKDNNRRLVIAQAVKMNIHRDLGRTAVEIERDFEAFLREIEDYLEDLGASMQPLGLHTLGRDAERAHQVSNVMQMLGQPLHERVGSGSARAAFAGDFRQLQASALYRFVDEVVFADEPLERIADPELRRLAQRGRQFRDALRTEREIDGVLRGLAARWIDPSYGGDPIRNPDALPTGRNMYGFDPSRIPTRAAPGSGAPGGAAAHRQLSRAARAVPGEARVQHVEHRDDAPPRHARGAGAVCDGGEAGLGRRRARHRRRADSAGRAGPPAHRCGDLAHRAVPRPVPERDGALQRGSGDAVGARRTRAAELHPRQHRAHPGAAVAARRRTRAGARVRAHAGLRQRERRLQHAAHRRHARLRQMGGRRRQARAALPVADVLGLRTRSGQLEPQAARRQRRRDQRVCRTPARHQRGGVLALVESARAARHRPSVRVPGGISMAVRHLDGRNPQLYISNLRDPQRAKLESAAKFLATELRSVYQHPRWVAEMQKEGYAGTLQMLEAVNNFWGWQVMDRNVVRDDQWQEFHEVYMKDRYRLGTREWFEKANPTAMAQIAERMLEAIRKDYWKADERTRRELASIYADLAKKHDVYTPNETFRAWAAAAARGFGMEGATPRASAQPAAPVQAAPPPAPKPERAEVAPPTPQPKPPEIVRGQELREVQQQARLEQLVWIYAWLIALVVAGGAGFQAWATWRDRRRAALPARAPSPTSSFSPEPQPETP
ncbi:MAG: cobaltochelatase subunit CobN [Burkholderiaceae bacterium]|nr:cobaltochelatase subunit CobN [Burkholderiaceae bacterium]